MNVGRNQQRAQPWAMCTGRSVVASVALVSLLSAFLPLGTASADNSGLKACCIGKAGHESGSCSTGLLASAKSEVSLPVAGTATTKLFANVKGGAGAAGHCSSHASVNRDADVESLSSQPDTIISEPAPSPATSGKSVSINIHAVSSTCPNECGMCSVSYTRRPRPREQSTQSLAIRPPSTSLIRLIVCEHSSVRAVDLRWSQSSPRAPPALLI